MVPYIPAIIIPYSELYFNERIIMILVISINFRYTQTINAVIRHRKGRIIMAVKLNEDKEMVKIVKDGLQRTGGYCPCRLERTEENKCICKEFREQIADPDFKGYCHCMLYYKE